jgi:cation transport ATPase
MAISVGVMVVLLFLSIAVNVLSFSLPRGVQRVTKKSPPSMNIFTDFIKIEQDKVSLRREELKIEEKKMSQDKEIEEKKMSQDKEIEEKKMSQDKEVEEKKMSQDKDLAKMRLIVSTFAIMAFLVFSVQLKDGLLGQATSFNTHLKFFSNSAKELNVSIKNGLKLIAGIISMKPVYNALRYLYKILGDKVLKWRVT